MSQMFRKILSVMLIASIFVLAAQAQEKITPFRSGAASGYTQGPSNVVYKGEIATIDTTSGLLVPAADSTNLLVVGCVLATSDNGGVDTSQYLATRKVSVGRGVWRLENGDSFTAADVGQMCYIEDSHTVQKAASATHDIPVGLIVEVDSEGVWVDTTVLSKVLSGSLAALAVSGNASVGGTLAATGNTTLGGTLGVTGVMTLTARPVLTTTNAPGSVVASPLNNLPTGATTNALYFTVTVGNAAYAVPMYALP